MGTETPKTQKVEMLYAKDTFKDVNVTGNVADQVSKIELQAAGIAESIQRLNGSISSRVNAINKLREAIFWAKEAVAKG